MTRDDACAAVLERVLRVQDRPPIVAEWETIRVRVQAVLPDLLPPPAPVAAPVPAPVSLPPIARRPAHAYTLRPTLEMARMRVEDASDIPWPALVQSWQATLDELEGPP